jgi:hypothetical protein
MSDTTTSLLRQLKLLVVVLILSNIALGVFGFLFLRSIDEKYSALIDQSVPTLHALQNLTVKASEAMRGTNPNLLADGKSSPAEIAQASRAAIEQDTEARERIVSLNWQGPHQEIGDVHDSGEKFDRAAADVVRVLESNDPAEVTRMRESTLRPLYNDYVAATTKAAELLKKDSLTTSNTLSLRSGNFSKVMLGIASWPIVILGAFLAFTALFVITVLVRVTLFKEEAA